MCDEVNVIVIVFIVIIIGVNTTLFFGISEGLMNRLQSVQNAAARLVTGIDAPTIYRQCWLSGVSPPYLADDCRLVADARERRLRSTASRTCVVTRT